MTFITVPFLTYTVAALLTICFCVYLFFKYAYSYWENLGVPFTQPEFIYGNMKKAITEKLSLGEQSVLWYNEFKSKGHRYGGIYAFFRAVFIPIDIELVKNIMAKDFEYFADRGAYCNEKDDPLSAHLITLEGLKWKQLRQKLTPTFTSGKLKNMFQTLLDCTTDLTTCLDNAVENSEPVDIRVVLGKYTTDVIGSVAFGINCNSFRTTDSKFMQMAAKNFDPEFFDKIKQFIGFLSPAAATFLKLRVTNKEVDHFYRSFVKDTVEYREKNNIVRNDFLQLLIQLKNTGSVDGENTANNESRAITMNEISAQTNLFFIAGYETSSTAMTFCLYELAQNPEIQQKVRNEIINVLKKYEGKITYDSVKEMHYLNRVVLETLRKHPPAMIMQRKVTKNYYVPHSNLILEKDTLVFISILGIHEDPEYYPDPKKFDPDRFTEENKATRPDYSFLPFGEGPRVCIGLRFAMMQTKVGLCRLLLNYKFKLDPKTCDPLVLEPSSFVRSVKNGIWLNAEKVTA